MVIASYNSMTALWHVQTLKVLEKFKD